MRRKLLCKKIQTCIASLLEVLVHNEILSCLWRTLTTAPHISSASSNCSPIKAINYHEETIRIRQQGKKMISTIPHIQQKSTCENEDKMHRENIYSFKPHVVEISLSVSIYSPLPAISTLRIFPLRLNSSFEQMEVCINRHLAWFQYLIIQTATRYLYFNLQMVENGCT